MNNSEKNQGFKTVDLFLVLGSILIVIGVVGPILHNHVQSESRITALEEARAHALEILSQIPDIEALERSPSSSGSLALEGPVGTDPWGQAFHYKVLRNSYGQPTHILVWSKGPNATRDTSERAFLSRPGPGESSISFEGDDLGHVVAFR